MGHVINPLNFRLGHSRYWNSIWGLSNLNNYAQLSSLDFLIFKKILYWFKGVLASDSFRYVFMLNSIRILRSNVKTTLILQFYDLFTINVQRSILTKVRLKLLKYGIFNARKWKKFKWLSVRSSKFLQIKRKFIFFLNNTAPFCMFSTKKTLRLNTLANKFFFYPLFVKSKKHFFSKYFSIRGGKYVKVTSKFKKPKFNNSGLYKLNKVLFLKFFLTRLRLYLFSGFNIIKNSLCYYLKPLLNLTQSNIVLIGLSDLTIDAKFISNFISYHLENRYYLNQIFKVLWSYLNKSIKNRLLYGYQVKLSGRFKKNEKAVYMVRKVGNLGRYDIKRFVDYSFSTARMRLGISGIKVWLSMPASRDMLIKAKFNAHFNKFYVPWTNSNLSCQIPVNALKSYISGGSLSWRDIIHSFSSTSVLLSNRILGRFNRSHLSHYSYIY